MSNFGLPELTKISSFELDKNEVFILSAGFEDRVEAFSSHIRVKHRSSAIILEYLPYNSLNKIDTIQTKLKDIGISEEHQNPIIYDRMHPNGFAHRLTDLLGRLNTTKVIIDISAMSKLAILLCMSVCEELNLSLRIYYCEAKKYGPTQEEYNVAKEDDLIGQPTMSMFTGIEDIHQVRRFSSVAMHGHPSAIIAFMSFNEQFIQVLLNRICPSHLFLINGNPPVHCWREEATAWIHQRLLEEWSKDNMICKNDKLPIRRSSTLDYRETVDILSSQYWAIATRCRVILAPTGSKMQTVGCFIFRQAHKDVHIEYPSGQGFLDEYSKGIGQAWIVDFGKIRKLISDFTILERHRNLFS